MTIVVTATDEFQRSGDQDDAASPGLQLAQTLYNPKRLSNTVNSSSSSRANTLTNASAQYAAVDVLRQSKFAPVFVR